MLYVRAPADLLHALDALAERKRQQHPGLTFSRADIAREVLYKAVNEEKEQPSM